MSGIPNVSNEKLFNAEKYQVYSFYFFWVIKGKSAGEGKNPPTQIMVKIVP